MRRLLVLVLLASMAPPAAAAPTLPLAHAGRWITDADGRVVIVHGINMVNKRAPYTPAAAGFDDADAAFLAHQGLRTVRVGVIYKAVEPQPGVYDDTYLDAIAQTVATLARHGLVATLDFHQDMYNERYQGEGFPDWAALDDGLPATPQAGFPGNYLLQPALQHAFDHLWANTPVDGVGLQDRYAAAWAHVAARFKDTKNVLGYELLNEPWPGTNGGRCLQPDGCPDFDATLTAFYTRVLRAIRAVDRRTLVLYEPNVLFNQGPKTHLGALHDRRLVFAYHDYCAQAGQAGSLPFCRATDDRVFTNAGTHAAATGDALLLTEFGATQDRTILRDMADRADRFRVGWQEWHYCGCDDPTTSGPGDQQALVRDPHQPPSGANVVAGTLAELARPSPLAVAGTPRAWGYDPASGRFSLTYDTRRAGRRGRFRAGARSEIVVPPRAYPHGYRARVRGGRVTSRRGGVLVVRSAARAPRVTVVVTRR